jgi:hypothetical protein
MDEGNYQTKVLGWDKQPLAVYHGASAHFDSFSDEFAGRVGTHGPGHYFTEDKSIAEHYASLKGGPLRKQYLDIMNPLYLNGEKDNKLSQFASKLYHDRGLETPVTLDRARTNMPVYQAIEDYYSTINPGLDGSALNAQGEEIPLRK